ncbi:hypothetical protein I302_106120 [Kwoniella bestiolae CBS 10118]|uniref:Histone deacetylase domain-containing protein n=1 Tax=Kwoniella bestiolae CBS 10118 TaxID=1296100 RepID=A0A1B9G333_9TREE|nr:hypothetical protein I302_05244 [Kwoniella bestiolae CBS 10118]OCF25424.1 hypothetical protein I302_05244 [Kwoniella bestiolae CBS 10118]
MATENGEPSRSRVGYIWSQELQDVSDDLPSNIGRSSMVHALIKALDLLDDETEDGDVNNGEDRNKARIVPPDEELGTEQCLLKYHDQSYIDALKKYRASSPPSYDPTAPRDTSSTSAPPAKRARTKGPNLQEYRDMDEYNLSHDNPPFPKLPRYITLIAAATSTACRMLVQDEVDFVVCWDGGRHHAKKSEAGGFCYINDLVLGLLLLSREGKITLPPDQHVKGKPKKRPPRILYLDLDLHYSDGVSSAFHSTREYPDPMPETKPPKPPSVMTFSIHHLATGFYPPFTPWAELTNPWLPTPFSLSIPLRAYPSSKTYKTIWEGCVEPIVKEWDPDYVVLQMGSDGLPEDRVGQFGNWSVEEEGGMRWCIDRVKKWGKKTCITGGGGYNHPNTARTWATITSSLLDRPINGETPIPHHEHFEEYAHSFTMEVPQGHMEDQNTEKYLNKACEDFGYIATRIKDIVASSLR